MRKIIACLLALTFFVTLTACGGTGQSSQPSSQVQATPAATPTPEPESSAAESEDSSTADPTPEATEATAPTEEPAADKALVVYFSWSGNTEAVANAIARQTGADIFRIEPETPYTDDYDALLDIAQEEQRNNARPAISGSIENFDQYSVVYLGYPNWWADIRAKISPLLS